MNGIGLHLTVKPLAGAIGAEIHGIDLCSPISDETVARIRGIWLEHSVVFFRDQELPPKDFAAFARRFGEVVDYPFLKGLDDSPEVIEVAKLEHERVNFGGLWHTDTAYLERPPMGTMLVAREVPPYGGDTLFASSYAAYDALSDGMKRLLDPLRAVNSSAKAEKTRTREDRKAGEGRKVLEAEHPVVRTHPETGRKALYVNFGHTLRFAGICSNTNPGPSSPAASDGSPAPSLCGTIVARCTIRSTTITAIVGSCIASPSRGIGRNERQ